MQAEVGDEITVRGPGQGDLDRHGEIIEILGGNGSPPYRVRWLDDYESVFFPSSGTAAVRISRLAPARQAMCPVPALLNGGTDERQNWS